MKRINNRGAILLETLIVSVFIMTIFVLVYRNSIPLMGEYEKLEKYDDIDSVYAANLIKSMVINYIDEDHIKNNLLNSVNYKDISNCNEANLYNNPNYCITIKRNLGIKDNDIIYLIRYNEESLNSFKSFVNSSNKFKNGKLSNFRSYLNTVTPYEIFYDPDSVENENIALYRVFISRTVTMMDGTENKKFANIGIYKNNYIGEE